MLPLNFSRAISNATGKDVIIRSIAVHDSFDRFAYKIEVSINGMPATINTSVLIRDIIGGGNAIVNILSARIIKAIKETKYETKEDRPTNE